MPSARLPVFLSLLLLLVFSVAATRLWAETLEAPSVVESSLHSSSDVAEEAPMQEVDKPVVTNRYAKSALPSQSVSSSGKLLSLILGVVFIVALIVMLGWLARRLGQGGLLGNKHIKVLAAMPLGTRERLVVVEVGGQQLLLGITATQINTLHTFSEPVITPEIAQAPSDFSQKLLAFMQQKPLAVNKNRP